MLSVTAWGEDSSKNATTKTTAQPPSIADISEDSKLNGRWKWQFVMPDGSEVSPVGRFQFDGQELTGSTRFRHASETAISEGKVQGDHVSFSVVRKMNDRTIHTRYSGQFRGETIVGTIESNWTGAMQTYPWEAKRLPDTPEGTWKWITLIKDRRVEYSLKAHLEGESIHGKLSARKGLGTDIKHGHFNAGTVSFEIERERDGEKVFSKFKGKLTGDYIRGKETAVIEGKEQTFDWVAIRTD